MDGTTEQATAKYDQIIAAAVDEFQEKGFAAASMDRVSARAEVSKRTVYKYFESKENLFQSIVEVLAARFADVSEVRYVPGKSVRAQLTNLAWAEGQLLTSPDVIRMSRMIISQTLRNPKLAEAAQGKIDKTPVFANLLKAAHADGQLCVEDPEFAAQQFIGLLKAKAFWPVLFGADIVTQDEMQEIIQASVEMMMRRYAV